MTLRIVGMMVAFAAVAVTMVLVPAAVPTSGDSPGTTGAPTGGGTAGGGDGLTVPGGDAQASNLWSANIGGTTTSGLDTSDIGRVLYRGTKRLIQTQSPTGDGATAEVCEGFPEITVSQSGASSGPGVDGIKLRLDYSACEIQVGSLTSAHTGVTSMLQRGGSAVTLGLNGMPNVANTPIAWQGVHIPLETSAGANPSGTRRLSRLTGAIEDRLQLDLTNVEIRRHYDTTNLTDAVFSYDCDTQSPFSEYIQWHEDACTGNNGMVATRLRAWARGRFHAELRSFLGMRARLNRDSRHTIYLRLEASGATEPVRSCTFTPVGIRGLTATFPRLDPRFLIKPDWSVTVDCRYTTGILTR